MHFVFVNLAGILQRHNGCVHSSLNLPQIVAVPVRIHYKPSPAALRYVTLSLSTSNNQFSPLTAIHFMTYQV